MTNLKPPEVQLLDAVWDLSEDEVRLLVEIAERLRRGQAQYGRLHLDADPRDFVHEAFEEAADLLVYLAAAKLRRSV